MIYAENLVMAYTKLPQKRVITKKKTPNVDILYFSDNESSGDDCKPKSNLLKSTKLDFNINKYIKRNHYGR